jgi:hypothetical protein
MGWQPIETAPKDRLILVYCPHKADNGYSLYCAFYDEGNSGFRKGPRFKEPSGFYNIPATHWMSLPAPPDA